MQKNGYLVKLKDYLAIFFSFFAILLFASFYMSTYLFADNTRTSVDRVHKNYSSDDTHNIIDILLEHAPYKQVHIKSGKRNTDIGKVTGGTCEVITFLVKAAQRYPNRKNLKVSLERLAKWVISHQSNNRNSAAYGGVPSTPDLKAPANRYYFTIDAAFCGLAMFDLYGLTKDKAYLNAGLKFARFIQNMHRQALRQSRNKRANGFCEFVLVPKRKPLWNCNLYVKNLIALPLLKQATKLSGKKSFQKTAETARNFLVTGLKGAWEYADFKTLKSKRKRRSLKGIWRRIEGPYREKNFFVYGDTVAYGLKALHDYEGVSKDLEFLYNKYVSYTGKAQNTKNYDARIAFAGYMKPKEAAPDEFSAYYDLVTLGILHQVRKTLNDEHYKIADAVLKSKVKNVNTLSWKMELDLTIKEDGYIDLVTLANLGNALLLYE